MPNVINFLKNLIKENDCIVVGISGGPDSMCLFKLLIDLKKTTNFSLICAHINHGLRKESEEEKEFVKNYCNKNKIIFEECKLEFENKKNLENNAREKRYNFFEKIIKKYHANYLMTAHHGDDLIETILMRLVRGSSLKGYAGFKKITEYQNYKIVRPLIELNKSEIENYLKQEKIEYRLDKTNESDDYTRNRYRHHFLPFLYQENANVHQKFLKFSQNLELIDQYLEKITNIILTEVIDFDTVNLRKFNELDLLLQYRVMEHILHEEYESDINKINEKHIQLILELCKCTAANKKINLPLNRVAIKNYNKLTIIKNKKIEKYEYILEDCIKLNEREYIEKITSTDIEKSNYILRLNSEEIKFPLKVRYRKNKDYMHIKNMKGTKKVKDIFINEKIPLEKRDTWPILTDAEERVIWIPGIKKSNFDKNHNEFYDIIYKYVMSEEKKNEEK